VLPGLARRSARTDSCRRGRYDVLRRRPLGLRAIRTLFGQRFAGTGDRGSFNAAPVAQHLLGLHDFLESGVRNRLFVGHAGLVPRLRASATRAKHTYANDLGVDVSITERRLVSTNDAERQFGVGRQDAMA